MAARNLWMAAALSLATLALPAGAETAPVAPKMSRLVLPAAAADGTPLGEISGLAWDADDALLYAVSDQGRLYRLRLERQGGTLRTLRLLDSAALVDPVSGEGRAESGRHFNAEGLALQRSSDGQPGNTDLVVALEERPPQIGRFSPTGQLLGRIPVPPPADDAAHYRKKNRGLESAAMHPQYGLVTAPEAPLKGRPEQLHTVYAQGHAWSFARHMDDSRLKGLDVLPDASLLVLERSRPGPAKDVQLASLRRVDLARCDAQGVCPAQLLAQLPAGPENFEGLALLDARHALIVSDNGKQAESGTTFVLITLP